MSVAPHEMRERLARSRQYFLYRAGEARRAAVSAVAAAVVEVDHCEAAAAHAAEMIAVLDAGEIARTKAGFGGIINLSDPPTGGDAA